MIGANRCWPPCSRTNRPTCGGSDHWVAMLVELNRTVYWFHPLAWFLRRRLTALAEKACDDAVIESLDNRTDYARYLLEFAARLLGQPRRLKPAAVAMAATPRLERRIDEILDEPSASIKTAHLPPRRLTHCFSNSCRAFRSRPASRRPAEAKGGFENRTIRAYKAVGSDINPLAGRRRQARARRRQRHLVKAADGSPVAGAHVTLCGGRLCVPRLPILRADSALLSSSRVSHMSCGPTPEI